MASQRTKTSLLFVTSSLTMLVIAELLVRLFVPVRNVGPSFSEYDTVYGKRTKKSFACERITPEFSMRFTSNSLGFRGPEAEEFPRRGILFIGDSFTEGYGVHDGEEFPALVRHRLNERHGEGVIPVVNCGIGDSGEGRWLKFLRNEGDRYNPQLVVLQLMENDFYDNNNEALFTLWQDSLVEHAPAPPGVSRVIQRIIESIPGLPYLHLIGLLRQASFSQPAFASHNLVDPSDDLTYKLVEQIASHCREKQWPILVLFVGLEGDRYDRMTALLQRHNVHFIDTPRIHERPEFFYRIDGHWNSAGHRHVAAQVWNAIDSAGFLHP